MQQVRPIQFNCNYEQDLFGGKIYDKNSLLRGIFHEVANLKSCINPSLKQGITLVCSFNSKEECEKMIKFGELYKNDPKVRVIYRFNSKLYEYFKHKMGCLQNVLFMPIPENRVFSANIYVSESVKSENRKSLFFIKHTVGRNGEEGDLTSFINNRQFYYKPQSIEEANHFLDEKERYQFFTSPKVKLRDLIENFTLESGKKNFNISEYPKSLRTKAMKHKYIEMLLEKNHSLNEDISIELQKVINHQAQNYNPKQVHREPQKKDLEVAKVLGMQNARPMACARHKPSVDKPQQKPAQNVEPHLANEKVAEWMKKRQHAPQKTGIYVKHVR